MNSFELKRVAEYRRSFFSIELLLPFFMLFAQYRIGPVSIVTVLLLIVAVLIVLRESANLCYSLKFWPYYLFLGYIIVCDVFSALLGPDPMQTEINRMTEYVVMFLLVFIVCSQSFDENRLYKCWKIAGCVFTMGILYHVVQIYVLKQSISPICIIPGYELRAEDAYDQFRPSSFFAEPAAFTNSMLPLLFLSLKRKDFKWAVFCTISILMSTSTVGVILSVVLWVMTLVIEKSSFKKKIVAIFVAAPIVWMFFSMEIFSVTQSKFFAVTDGESTFGSRVLTGLELVQNMPNSDLIFGSRYGNVVNYVTDNLNQFSGCETLLYYWKCRRLFLNAFSQSIFNMG